MQRGSMVTVAIHPDAGRTRVIASDRRVVLATATLGTHDENYTRARGLADAFSREAWNCPAPDDEAGWAEALVGVAGRTLHGKGGHAFLSFTLILLENDRARIWNCGGHRVVAISSSGARQAAMDGFADTSHQLLRSIVKVPAGPETPVPTSVVHRADVRLADIRLLVISPHGQLLSLPGIGQCTRVEEIVQHVEQEVRLPHALVGISSLNRGRPLERE